MKKLVVFKLSLFTWLLMVLLPAALRAQDKDRAELLGDAARAREAFIQADPLMKSLFDNSAGYVIFPNIGKGAIGIGGAAGNGILYEKGKAVGKAEMKQLTIGFQLGGQAYREVIFFEHTAALDRFKEGNFELSAQASAVAVTKGASTDAQFRDGIMIFTEEKGGLMYEASVGGQKFSYRAF